MMTSKLAQPEKTFRVVTSWDFHNAVNADTSLLLLSLTSGPDGEDRGWILRTFVLGPESVTEDMTDYSLDATSARQLFSRLAEIDFGSLRPGDRRVLVRTPQLSVYIHRITDEDFDPTAADDAKTWYDPTLVFESIVPGVVHGISQIGLGQAMYTQKKRMAGDVLKEWAAASLAAIDAPAAEFGKAKSFSL